MTFLRNLDLVLLALALPVFLVAGLPVPRLADRRRHLGAVARDRRVVGPRARPPRTTPGRWPGSPPAR